MTNYAARCMLILMVSLMACEATLGRTPEDTSEQGAWGDWGPDAYCPPGEFVWGFRLKSEPYQGSGDDTALNAVELICKNGVNETSTYIRSSEGDWGIWSNDHLCRGTPAMGFRIQVEPFQGKNKDTNSKDDTAAGNIQLVCNNPPLTGDPPAAWGEWTRAYVCEINAWMRGFRTKVERPQGSGDDTALNAMQVHCGFPVP